MKLSKRIVPITLVLLLAVFSIANTQPLKEKGTPETLQSPWGPKAPMKPMTPQRFMLLRLDQLLQLTEDQRQKIRPLLQAHQDEIGKIARQIHERRIELHKLLLEPEPSEKKLEAQVDKLIDLQGKMQKEGIKFLFKARQYLTLEQKTKLFQIFAHRLIEPGGLPPGLSRPFFPRGMGKGKAPPNPFRNRNF